MKITTHKPRSSISMASKLQIFLTVLNFSYVAYWHSYFLSTYLTVSPTSSGAADAMAVVRSSQEVSVSIQEYAANIDLTRVPPKGSPPNLIPQKATKEEVKNIDDSRKRLNYGGLGDKAHLGGFTEV